ncbi:MAG: outer membrane protein [Hyphomicrobiaceae bacterium]|jgi:outer membrane immunogenic protein
MSKRLKTAVAGVLLACACVSVSGNGVSAADLGGDPNPYPAPMPPPRLELERWTGFYLGGALGYGWGQGEATDDFGSFSFDQSGLLGSIYAGYNWQFGRSVFGIEADVGTGDFGTSDDNVGLRSSLNAMGSMRARYGYLLTPALLIYGTGGVAWADMDFKVLGDSSQSETFFGYQYGGGAELAVSEHVALRLEYIYTNFDSERVIHSGTTNTYEPDFNTVRAGVSFKF